MRFSRHRRLAAVLLLLALSPVARLLANSGFEQDESDLDPAPGARFGNLPNGLRFVVLASREPPGRASFRLVVRAGSRQESEDQRGLAHFLEHLAFKGSAHYPPGTLIERLQRLGMSYGADTNARTEFDYTEYRLELPDTRKETLEDACAIFADYAGGLLFREDQIEAERGVVLSEMRDRDSVDYRASVAELRCTLGESLVPARMPIGSAAIIRSAGRDKFLDYYDAWYRPERMTVIAVGDFNARSVAAMIRRDLARLAARAPARPDPGLGRVAVFSGLRIEFDRDAEAPATTVAIEAVAPVGHEADTRARRLEELADTLALGMLNRRLAALSRREDAPFSAASGAMGRKFDFVRGTEVRLTCGPARWREALAVGERELRRALRFGFSPAELSQIAADARRSLEESERMFSIRGSRQLADGLVDAVVENTVFTSPEQDISLYEPAIGRLNGEDCRRALERLWDVPGRYVLVAGNLEIADPEGQIRSAYAASQAQPVTPPEDPPVGRFSYTDFGPPGRIETHERIRDLGITEVVFDNGVRLNLKRTESGERGINLVMRVGGGRLTEPAATQPGLAVLAEAAFREGGLGRFSVDELQRVLAGASVGIDFKVSDDAFLFAGSTDSSDLLLEFRLLAAYLTDPGFRPESLASARREFERLYRGFDSTVEGVIATRIARLLANGDPRFGAPPENELKARTLEEVKAWMAPQLARGPIEVAVSGDFETDAVIDAVAQTLGALPARERKPPYAAERRVAFPAVPVSRDYTVPTRIPHGLVLMVWPTTDGNDPAVAQRLDLLASVFNDRLRLKIRNEMAGAYAPAAVSTASDVFPGYGWIQASIPVDPATAGEIAGAVAAIAADLHSRGVSADELERAKNPAVAAIAESVSTNRYWLNTVLCDAQEEPQRIGWARARLASAQAITRADLAELAGRYLDPARAFRFIISPAPPGPLARGEVKSAAPGAGGREIRRQ